jgi:hypothetical protein
MAVIVFKSKGPKVAMFFPVHNREGFSMPDWCTVTFIAGSGRRHSLDIYADSSFDAAHLYLTQVIGQPGCGN